MKGKGLWRFAAMLLAVLLLGGAALAEQAAPEAETTEATGKLEADLFDLFDFGGESMTWKGVAIPMSDGLLITSAANIGTESGYLAVSDGSSMWEAEDIRLDDSGVVALILYDETVNPPARTCYAMPDADWPRTAADLTVRSGDEMTSRLNRAVLSMSNLTWQSRDCLLLTLSDSVVPGAAVLTESGALMGMIVAEYGEGENRYVALTLDGIYQILTEEAAKEPAFNLTDNPPEGYEVRVDGNLVTFDYSKMTMEPAGENETIFLVVADSRNAYMTYFPIDEGEGYYQMVLTPGRTYVSGFIRGSDVPDDYPAQTAVTTLPEAEPLTDYNFHSVLCCLAEGPAEGMEDDELPTPVTEITEEFLRSGRAYFYSSSTYEVPEMMEETLLITLTTPTGENLRHVSGWVYDPELGENDTWAMPMSDTGLLDLLNLDGYPKGVYELAFYVGGELGDRMLFELK